MTLGSLQTIEGRGGGEDKYSRLGDRATDDGHGTSTGTAGVGRSAGAVDQGAEGETDSTTDTSATADTSAVVVD